MFIRLVPLHDHQNLGAITYRFIEGRRFPTVLQKAGAAHKLLGLFNRNYVAGLTTRAQKKIWEPLRPGIIPKIYVLEAEISFQSNDTINLAG